MCNLILSHLNDDDGLRLHFGSTHASAAKPTHHASVQCTQIADDAKEAQSTLKDMECMRTWCCCLMIFSSCCDCDRHKERDATRRMRLRECASSASRRIHTSCVLPGTAKFRCERLYHAASCAMLIVMLATVSSSDRQPHVELVYSGGMCTEQQRTARTLT